MNKSIDLAEVLPGIYRLSIPIPVPLKAVNTYLLRGKDGWSIVDCGFHDEATEKQWNQAFEVLGIRPSDVEKIVVTHYHPDHYGAAGWLQQQTGAPVLMHDRETAYIQQTWHNHDYPQISREFFERHGMPESIAERVEDEHRSRYPIVAPHPKITPLTENEEVRLGDGRYRVIWAPGHTEGLMVLWDEHAQLLLSNDMVLPKITPNISLNPLSRSNPLEDFFWSLSRMKELPAQNTLPGHRSVITNLVQRVDEIRIHHDERLARLYSIIEQGTVDSAGINAWEICLSLFGRFSEAVQHKFAMAETLSHIEYLVSQEKVIKLELDHGWCFSV